jgi:aldehyde:ferredoxin oxidoreductase
MEKIIRINMSKMKISFENTPAKYKKLGGRGLTSKILFDEVDPTCDPLGPENKIILAPGLFGGTYAPCSGRLSIGAKSPLTGGIKESNAGGTAGRALSKLGIKALIIEGESSENGWYMLKLNKDGCDISPADKLVGLGNYKLIENIKELEGKNISIISIGTAGEKQLLSSGLAVSDLSGVAGNFAARGGMGAVLGSKKIKAIVINEQKTNFLINYYDKERFKEISKNFIKKLIKTKEVLHRYGTNILLDIAHEAGAMPTKNFNKGQFNGHKKINSKNFCEIYKRKGKMGNPCMAGCPIQCKVTWNDKEGNFFSNGLEYESTTMLGPNCGIDDWDTIANLNRQCNDYGIDTIEAGVAIGLAMEAGLLEFGDGKGAIKLLEEISKNTTLGRVIGNGAYITGKVLGIRKIPVVKRQAIPAWEPRSIKGTGVTYAISPMGADHTAGNALPGRPGITPNLNLDPHNPIDKAKLSWELQVLSTCLDCALCWLVGPSVETIDTIADLLSAKIGLKINREDVLKIGENTLKLEKEFNRRAGFTEINDRLPRYFKKEKLSPFNTVFDIPDEELDEIFNKKL